MAPRIYFGVNLNFAKYVYGRKRALEVVRRQLGLRDVEMVADNDFGPAFYLKAPEAFRQHHWQVADHAKSLGVRIHSVFTVYRDAGAIAHSHPDIRESAYAVGLSIIEQAGCYGAQSVGLSLFTMSREEAEDPERFQSGFDASLEIWRRWMSEARRVGLRRLHIEVSAAYREGCSTIEDTRSTLKLLDSYHEKNPGSTVPVDLCYDTGHGISPAEERDDANRDFRAWFSAFPDRISEIHLKNTDVNFLETWHVRRQGGIISPGDVVEAMQEHLAVPEVRLFLEIPGKRGREVGEKQALEDHLESILVVRDALAARGYCEDPQTFAWTPPAGASRAG